MVGDLLGRRRHYGLCPLADHRLVEAAQSLREYLRRPKGVSFRRKKRAFPPDGAVPLKP